MKHMKSVVNEDCDFPSILVPMYLRIVLASKASSFVCHPDSL